MYTCFAEKLQNPTKKADEEAALEISKLAKEVLPVWGKSIPALREILIQIIQGKSKEEAFQKLGLILKQLVPQGKGDREVPAQELELMHAIGSYFRTGSENMANKLIKFASLSKSPYVVQRLAPQVGDQQSTKQQLEKLLRKLVGRKDTAMTPEEAVTVRDTDPDGYKQYLALRRDFNQSWKDALAAFVRKSGKHTVPFKEANAFLRMNGIDHMLPVGFTGLVDDLGRFYTSKGKLIDGVPNAVSFPSITMNPNFGHANGGDWVFMANRPDGSAGPYFYTTEFKKGQSQSKFKKVGELSTKIDGMRKKWMARVKNFAAEDPQCVAATILEILYEFAARIGSTGNSAGGTSTYGVATLLVKHATITPDGNITLRYKGKDGVPTTHKITKTSAEGRLLIRNLNELLVDKGPKDRIFTVTKGHRLTPITPAQVNQFFKACGAPEGVTVHKIRTVTGTKIFTELMSEQLSKRKPKNEKQAMELFKKLAEAVGKKLNHVRNGANGSKVTGATALQAYIDPVAQLEYWHSLGFRVPKSLEKFDQALMGEHQ
jgi:hypothetical protein